jgi:hypothetical protein
MFGAPNAPMSPYRELVARMMTMFGWRGACPCDSTIASRPITIAAERRCMNFHSLSDCEGVYGIVLALLAFVSMGYTVLTTIASTRHIVSGAEKAAGIGKMDFQERIPHPSAATGQRRHDAPDL